MISVDIPYFAYNKAVVLEKINASFKTGQTHGVVGLNGAGKTTFFNLLAGNLKDNNCRFLIKGEALSRRETAYIDTDLFFYPKLTGQEFLSVFPSRSPTYDELKLAGLFKLPLDGFIEEYSTGMKKKLLLLSQIKQDKRVYILDEPFNGLDLETNKILEVIISILNERGKTVFISSHILDPLLAVCSNICYLKDKRIFRTYVKNEFNLIEEELFGTYTRNMRDELGNSL